MKVQLIVVQGKPEGKVIPLVGPVFKIGRGETCHLRPNSELVSREHAQFTVQADKVTVEDLGSRNGTLVNGKALTEVHVLKDRDLVQVGALTFALSIQGAPAAAPVKAAAAPSAATAPVAAPATPVPASAPKGGAAPDDVSFDDIESWLVADSKSPAPERPSGVYGGDTITITAFRDGAATKPAAPPAPAEPATDEEYERQQESEEASAETEEEDEEETEDEEAGEDMPEEFIDESNPFFVKKKKEAEVNAKPVFKDTSDAASDILRRMMERRRSQKSS